ncbi:site-specific DNA-methyltransferase [Enterococcus sp. UD-01]|jgi:DNA modification methylase|uniref:site-specific DNA-methyltransferase n=1 Tax=Enterococcus sp. UD-01 TaxID=3373911 RepID=UPI0038329F47
MLIKKMNLSDLKPADYNPRVDLKPGMPEYEKLKKSIEEFGFIDPPIFNKQTGNLVGGHQRVSVAKDLGITAIEVSVIDVPLEKEKQLNIALNKISGQWDENKLAVLLQTFSDDEVVLSGFDSAEASDLIDRFEYNMEIEQPIEEDNFDVDQAVKEIKKTGPVAQYGDIWQLGQHRLMCGDATLVDDIDRLMDGAAADLVVTDPPYNVAVESESEELSGSGRETILNDDMSDEEFQSFLHSVFASYTHLMADHSAIYVFHASSTQRDFEDAMNANDILVRSQCIWVKNSSSNGWSQYRWQHEPVFYAHKKKCAPFWQGNRKQSTVWRDDLLDDLPSTIWECSRGNVNAYVHPTQKPLSLLAIPIRNSSKKDHLIVDLFGGSGSTLMCAHELDRRCYTLELDPVFCDVIIKRFEESTGIKAVKIK